MRSITVKMALRNSLIRTNTAWDYVCIESEGEKKAKVIGAESEMVVGVGERGKAGKRVDLVMSKVRRSNVLHGDYG